jgi:uracil-DNA glycosylase family 4
MPDSLLTLNTELLTCRKCPRLVEWREQVARVKRKAYQDQDYWGKPVPGFGDPQARVLGLAPGAHGSNRTGRQFTGDASGAFLYPALYRAGFISDVGSWVGSWSPDHNDHAQGPVSRDDGLTLTDMYITPVCRCAPPGNKPLPEEMDNCQPYLERELALIHPKVIVVLGRIAFERVLRIMRPTAGHASPPITFSHGAVYPLNTDLLNTERWLVCSYHPSQQNTLTGKLTVEMFDSVWQKVKELLAAP